MSRILEILELLSSRKSNARIINAALTDPYNPKRLGSTLSRLKQKGFVEKKEDFWNITASGKNYINLKKRFEYFDSHLKKTDKKNLILIFDIKESERAKRDWLRYQIKKFHFVQIQRSVWHGPSPLPADFVDYLKEIGIRDSIKMFLTNKEL